MTSRQQFELYREAFRTLVRQNHWKWTPALARAFATADSLSDFHRLLGPSHWDEFTTMVERLATDVTQFVIPSQEVAP